MQKNNSSSPIWAYAQKHWFSLALVAFALFIFIKKDFTFRLDLKAPPKKEQMPSQKSPTPVREISQGTKERMTENQTTTPTAPVASQQSLFDRLSFWSSGDSKVSTAYEAYKTVDEDTKVAFMKRFSHVAVTEQGKYGVPASIIMANAMLHSHVGKRDIAQYSKNQFAVRCTSDWNGETTDYSGECYRHYENAWMSFRDHSLFLSTGKNAGLPVKNGLDYKAWAQSLEDMGFSEEYNLAECLVQIVEEYRLFELDN